MSYKTYPKNCSDTCPATEPHHHDTNTFEERLDTEFVIYGDSAHQVFSWLSPFIEKAGYRWERSHPQNDTREPSFGGSRVKIYPETPKVRSFEERLDGFYLEHFGKEAYHPLRTFIEKEKLLSYEEGERVGREEAVKFIEEKIGRDENFHGYEWVMKEARTPTKEEVH